MGTGQLRGSVGTPDNPRLTFEEAARQCGMDRDLVLWVGQDILPAGEDEFPKKRSEADLKRIRNQVDEEQLPRLPPDVLPGGWDALERPWALVDCPAERVPQIPSVHGTSRVTVAALVSFPPEPFFFVNLMHLDGAILVMNKVGHSAYSGLQGELDQNRTLKDAPHTYGRVKPPRYKDSVPVQECLKEPRWSAYREGRWGNRINPPAPAGDVRPGAMANVPVGERLVSPTAPVPLEDESTSKDSSGSHPSSSSAESSPGPRQRVRRLTRRMNYSEPEEVSGSTTGEAVDSPPHSRRCAVPPMIPRLRRPIPCLLLAVKWKQVSPPLREPLPSSSEPVGREIDSLKHTRRKPHGGPVPRRPDPRPRRTSPHLPSQLRPSLCRSPDPAGDRSIQTRGRIMRMLHDAPARGLSGKQ